MIDPSSVSVGTEVTFFYVNDAGAIHVNWDEGRKLGKRDRYIYSTTILSLHQPYLNISLPQILQNDQVTVRPLYLMLVLLF